MARRKAAARGKISIDEAFHKLLPRLGPDGTVELMNAALRDPKRAKLWCNRKKVDPGFFRTHLVVRARLKAKRRWTAEIEATRALEKPVGSYTWKVDSKQIEALPQPELERPWPTVSCRVNWSHQILAPATPPSEPDPTPEPPSSEIDRILEDLPRRPVGRPRKHDWQAIHAEIARRCIDPKTGRVKVPKSDRKLARDMLNWCQDNNKKEPAESEMRDAVRAVCTALRPLQK